MGPFRNWWHWNKDNGKRKINILSSSLTCSESSHPRDRKRTYDSFAILAQGNMPNGGGTIPFWGTEHRCVHPGTTLALFTTGWSGKTVDTGSGVIKFRLNHHSLTVVYLLHIRFPYVTRWDIIRMRLPTTWIPSQKTHRGPTNPQQTDEGEASHSWGEVVAVQGWVRLQEDAPIRSHTLDFRRSAVQAFGGRSSFTFRVHWTPPIS